MLDNGKNSVLYLDYGNTALVPNDEIGKTGHGIWSIPPIAKPFRLISK